MKTIVLPLVMLGFTINTTAQTTSESKIICRDWYLNMTELMQSGTTDTLNLSHVKDIGGRRWSFHLETDGTFTEYKYISCGVGRTMDIGGTWTLNSDTLMLNRKHSKECFKILSVNDKYLGLKILPKPR